MPRNVAFSRLPQHGDLMTGLLSLLRRLKNLIWALLGVVYRATRFPTQTAKSVLAIDRRLLTRYKHLTARYGSDQLPLITLSGLVGHGPFGLSHYSFAPWSAHPLEHVLLQGLAARFKGCHFLEIGSLRGEVLASVSPFASSVTSITLSKAQMKELGYQQSLVDTNLMFEKDISNLEVIYADSLKLDFGQLKRRFNLVFIDGAHTYSAILSDTRNAVSVRAQQSALVWHDYAPGGDTVDEPVFAGILEGVPEVIWHRLFHVSSTSCAVLLPPAWLTRSHSDVFHPEQVYEISLRAKGELTAGDGG